MIPNTYYPKGIIMHANTELVCDYITNNWSTACTGFEYDVCNYREQGHDIMYAMRWATADLIRWAERESGVPFEERSRRDHVMTSTGIHQIMQYDLDHLYA